MGRTNFSGPVDSAGGYDVNGVTVINSSGDVVAGVDPSDLTLTDGNVFVGNGSNVAAGVTMSGDATIINTGVLTVTDSAGLGGLFVKKTALALYDFSVDGGTEGTITLASTATIPDNAVVTAVTYDVITTVTSSSDAATIALQLPTDGLLSTAIAISDGTNPWDAGAHLASVITPIAQKTTAARALEILTAGGQDITAGKIVFAVDYYISS